MFRPDRSPDRPVKHLEWRLGLFALAAALAGVGMYADAGWLIWTAMAVLVAGLLVRFVPEREEGDGAAREDGGGGEAS